MKSITTYLNFNGKCGEAMKFYQRCFGADLHMMPFSEAPGGNVPPGAKDRIMHAAIIKNGVVLLMASDTMPDQPSQQGNNFSICLSPETAEETDKLFNAFGEGGKVTMPLQDTFWGARFGTLTDKFGVNWMFNYEKPKE